MAARLTLPRRTALALAATLLVAGCTGSAGEVTPSVGAVVPEGPTGTVGPAVAQTRIELVQALGTKNLVLQDSQAQFRPPEDPTFTTTPRALYQVILPKAPLEGFIVVYEFADPMTAATAAAAQAAYLATGPAKVQSPFGARHIIRLVGSTVVQYTWVPEGAEDPLQPDIQTALETLGTGVQVPS
jgi:hypothetical protein